MNPPVVAEAEVIPEDPDDFSSLLSPDEAPVSSQQGPARTAVADEVPRFRTTLHSDYVTVLNHLEIYRSSPDSGRWQ